MTAMWISKALVLVLIVVLVHSQTNNGVSSSTQNGAATTEASPGTTHAAGATRMSRLQRGRLRLRARFRKRLGPTEPPPTTTPGTTTTHIDEGVTTAITEDGIILREPMTRSTVNRAQVAIRKLVDDNRTPAGHHPFNAGILRLSFHDCVGLLGCDGCINHKNRANSGVAFYARKLDELWELQFKHSMTQADFWALAGVTVVQYSMELNPNCRDEGCRPEVPYFWGRNDCGVSNFFVHTFCPIHDDATTFFQEEFGLDKPQYTALMGAHTLGRVNTFDGDTWDKTPDYFDNNYYVVLADKANKWKRANRTSVPELNESWTNINGSLLMLGSDIALLSNLTNLEDCNPDPLNPKCPKAETRDLVEMFASDNKLFLAEFVKSYARVIHKSPFKLHPVVEDVPWGPRWERPGTLPTWPPTTTTTTTTTPKPIVRGTAPHDATTPFKGAKFCLFNNGELCPFMEQMTTDDMDVELVSAGQWPYGPNNPSIGSHYMFLRANSGSEGRTAWIKIKEFKNITGCLHLARYQSGTDSGSLTVYKAYGGLYPGNVVMSTTSANTTEDWVHQQYGLPKDELSEGLSHELIIEFKMGNRGVIAVDDVLFDDRQECW